MFTDEQGRHTRAVRLSTAKRVALVKRRGVSSFGVGYVIARKIHRLLQVLDQVPSSSSALLKASTTLISTNNVSEDCVDGLEAAYSVGVCFQARSRDSRRMLPGSSAF